MTRSHRLELLIADRRLSEEEFDTPEGVFVRAYDAARQAAVTVLACHGLRVPASETNSREGWRSVSAK